MAYTETCDQGRDMDAPAEARTRVRRLAVSGGGGCSCVAGGMCSGLCCLGGEGKEDKDCVSWQEAGVAVAVCVWGE